MSHYLAGFILAMSMVGLLSTDHAHGMDEDPGIYFVPNVVDQFNKLALRPDGLAFSIGNSPDPTQFRHYQGLARRQGQGQQYLFISRSGNWPFPDPPPPATPAEHYPGNLLIVRMGSRDWTGERWRSNRLARDWSVNDPFWATPPDPRDQTVAFISFDGTGGWPAYGHPGGMQLLGDVLVVPLETPYESDPDNLILFLDVSSPESPYILSRFNPGTGSEFSAGLVGIAPMLANNGKCCNYLLLVTGYKNKELRVFRSLPTDPFSGVTDLKDSFLTWQYLRSYTENQIEDCISEDWHTGSGDAHNMLNFVREGDLDGNLYLIGGRNTTFAPSGDDYIDLYKVNFDPDGNPAECFLTFISKKHLTSYPIMGGGDSANFAAASGVHVSPSGELIIYSAEYENDGPWDLVTGKKSVRFGEWRHQAVVRSGSPTLRPAIVVDNDTYSVDEGSAVGLSADGHGPLTKAWITLFEDDGVGSSLPGFGNSDEWLHVDYEDWGKDDFYDFRKLDFSDQAGSWRWFAHEGCTIRVNDDDFDDGDFPGIYTRDLYGLGIVLEEPDLDQVLANGGNCCMDDKLTSMEFFPDCNDYYSADIGVHWDLDADGSFETPGKTVDFSASDLDGPSVVSVIARAEHPSDTTPLGDGESKIVSIIVKNVPPSIDSFAILDTFGLEIGTEIPVSLVHLEIAAEAYFTDPGKPDTQTASLDWGDGLVEPHTVFDFFTDAFGGVIGQLRHTRIPDVPADLSILLKVVDDDGGLDTSLRSIRVVSASEAIVILIDQIDDLIATATDVQLIAALQQVRNQLIGNNTDIPENGALDKLASGDFQSALVMIEAAIEAIVMAEAVGAGDLSSFKNLLGLTAESVAQELYLEALDLFIAPSKGEAKQILKIEQSITDGHSFLLSGNYPKALDKLQKAVGLALDLISG